MQNHEFERIVQLLQLILHDFISKYLLVLEVIFVANDHCLNFIMRVVFNFEKPLIKVLKTVPFREIKH